MMHVGDERESPTGSSNPERSNVTPDARSTASSMAIGSVVIPAWNEAAVIGRTLRALFEGIDAEALEVVVACNGCTDGTVDVVVRSGPAVTVLDLPPLGKTGAIRAAEVETSILPRIYLDADIELTGRSAIAVLEAMRRGAIAARPPFVYDTQGASRLVKRYYRQRLRLPTVIGDLCGAGCYGLSSTARARFEEFPELIADDLFAARIVTRSEVEIVPCEPVTVIVPRRIGALIRTLARTNAGNRQLFALMPEVADPTARATFTELVRSINGPRGLVDATIYALVVTLARVRAVRSGSTWERDDTSREAEG